MDCPVQIPAQCTCKSKIIMNEEACPQPDSYPGSEEILARPYLANQR